jgi:protein MpaA
MQGKTPAYENPWIETHLQWAQSSSGLPISLYQNFHRKDKNPYLFIGGIHGDEPEGVRLAEDFLMWLKSHSSEKDHPWSLIPCLNPEGYESQLRTNSRGVDLNRNFPSRDWLGSSEKNRYYPGPQAASEPEVRALVQLISQVKPRVIFHFHSWKPCVVYTGEPGRPYAELLSRRNHYSCHPDIGYPTPGSLGQYGWLEHQIPVICLEEEEKSSLELAWLHFKDGLVDLIQDRGPA